MATNSFHKPALCLPFILKRLKDHQKSHSQPFFLGVNGVQGSGKTTLVTALETILGGAPHGLSVVAFSIDDLYLMRDDQAKVAAQHATNPLLQHRGQPGTHDLSLARGLFESLRLRRRDILIPTYDKSAHNGLGDRAPVDLWRKVNKIDDPTIDVVILEGWCVGFRSLPQVLLREKWQEAKQVEQNGTSDGRLGKLELYDVETVNEMLKSYDDITDTLAAFIYLDAESSRFAYDWRIEQEQKLVKTKGSGMTTNQVIDFVNGYYPAYELYSDQLRAGIFTQGSGKQLNLKIAKDRSVKAVQEL